MNKNDYQQYCNLNSTFQQKCREIGKKLKKLNWVYGDEYTEYAPYGNEIECFTIDEDRWYPETHIAYFPAYLLWSTDEEIDHYVSDKLSKEEENVNYVGDTIIQVDEDDFDDFFVGFHSDKEYQDIVGKCFINNRIGDVVKVLMTGSDPYPSEFIYERFNQTRYGAWITEDYIWLQEQNESKYEKYKVTPYANINIGSEGMFHLGKNGKLYTSVSCGDEWYEYHEISNEEFEKIREEALNNLDK